MTEYWNKLRSKISQAMTNLQKLLVPDGSLDSCTLSDAVSQRIRIARPLCIFFMVYVHVNPGPTELDFATHGIRFFDWFRNVLADGIGRTSIGLLAMVSGYLAITTGRLFPFQKFALKRVKSLFVPMVLWSGLILMMYIAGDQVKPGYLEHHTGESFAWYHFPNWLFGITDHPANFPLGFLRDLFICALLTPVFIYALRKAAIPLLVVLFVLIVTHLPTVFLGNNIPFLYALGVLFALNHQPMTDFVDRFGPFVIGAFLLYVTALTGFNHYLYLNPEVDLLNVYYGFMEVERIFGAAAFWAISGLFLGTPLGRFMARFEPYSFLVFCSHMIITTAIWVPYRAVFDGYYGALYPVFFILATPAAFLFAIIGGLIAKQILPSLMQALNGGRPLPKLNFAQNSKTVQSDTLL